MPAFAKGDRVIQPQYGAGTLTEVNDRHTVIEFDEHGPKTFITSLVTLERTSEPAPARPRKRVTKKKTAAKSS